MPKARILIIDDEADIGSLLAEALSESPYQVEWTTRPLQALDRVKQHAPELILLDVKMPEISGLELLPRLKKIAPETAIMIMSAFGNIPVAVEAMKRGADDYLEKPFRNLEELRLTVARLMETVETRRENRSLRQQLEEKFKLDNVVSASPKMQDVFATVRKIAPLATTVLITGETGTGKELIARTLHHNSPRTKQAFVSVNCGGLPEGLLESLLFGHERGTFTDAVSQTRGYFEQAEGGTLFFDEIGDMPLALQVKLLRVLQEKTFQRLGNAEEIPVDVRLLAATHKDLPTAVAKGLFRQDLFYRLNVITIPLPPLRDRREDVSMLARQFVDKSVAAFHCSPKKLTPEAVHYLCTCQWPGNVRQLEHAIERAVALTDGALITAQAFADAIPSGDEDIFQSLLHMSMRQARFHFEKHYLLEQLRLQGGNVTKAARQAGLPRQNFHRKMKQLGITAERLVALPDFSV